MDERPDQRTNAQATPQTPAPPVNAPPPMTPAPQGPPSSPTQNTPVPPYPGYPYPDATSPGPQYLSGYGHTRMPPLPEMPSQPSGSRRLTEISARIPERTRGPLGRPFPWSISLLVVGGSVVLLALVFAVRVLLLGGDWADGAVAIGIVALALAALFGLIGLLRVAVGRRTIGFALLTIVLVASLAVTGAAGLLSSTPLHLAQAQTMEKSGQWSIAIREYGLSGQQGPNAPDIARVQNAWGQQLLRQNDYQDALSHFQTVLDDYQQSGDAVKDAQRGQFQAYAAWIKDDPNSVPYRDAITAFTNYAANPDCASDCKKILADLAPQAYYLYGSQLLQQKRYQLAITEFSKLETQYGDSAYAQQGHTQAATAYLAYGKQQISNQDCSGAVTSFKTLVTSYKGTPEATTAQNALKAPQDVTGFITKPPTNPAATAHLSKHMNWSTLNFSDEYSTTVDSKTGAFTFKLVAQGTYYLSMTHPSSGGAVDYYVWPVDNTGKVFYSFTVTPLCPVQLGTLP